MVITIILSALGVAALLAILALVGRISLVSDFNDNERRTALVVEFHRDLVTYAKSNGADQQAFQRLSMNTSAVKRALGWDNIVSGVRIGYMMLNGTPLLPLAIHEMRREYTEGYGYRDRGGEIADVVQTVLFLHAGRRREASSRLDQRMHSVRACIAAGWTAVAALPLAVLSTSGVLSKGRADAARSSIIFKLWRLLLAIAALSAPLLAYLADREKIDAGIRALLVWW